MDHVNTLNRCYRPLARRKEIVYSLGMGFVTMSINNR